MEAPEEVAHKLGLTAAEMYAAIEALRAAGQDIKYVERQGRHGLVLGPAPHRTIASEIEEGLTTRVMGRTLFYRDEIDSTSSLALKLASEGADHGTTVIAARQTAGRGRRGRSWLSLPGEQLFLSVILRTSLPAGRVFELKLVAAVALAEALETCGIVPGIKWPNDIEVDGRKLAGILCEGLFDAGGQLEAAVVGVGVNVDAAPEEIPEELRGRATSIRAETGRTGLTVTLAMAFLERLEEWLVLHGSLGFETVLETWRTRSTSLDTEVRALVDGRVITGIAEDVDASGALLVRDGEGHVHRIIAGEVTTLRRLPAHGD